MESKTPRTLSEPKSYTDLEYAVMYKSRCEKLETELAGALGEIRGLRQLVNDCHIVAGQLETERNEVRAEIEKFNSLFKNGIDCFASPCEKHSGENTPPFDEFIKKYGYKCTPCLVEELAEAQTENNVLKAVVWYYCTQRGPNVIEELSEKVKRLESMILTIQAWNIDKSELRGHHCIAKQWICSLQDQIKRYKKGKR